MGKGSVRPFGRFLACSFCRLWLSQRSLLAEMLGLLGMARREICVGFAPIPAGHRRSPASHKRTYHDGSPITGMGGKRTVSFRAAGTRSRRSVDGKSGREETDGYRAVREEKRKSAVVSTSFSRRKLKSNIQSTCKSFLVSGRNGAHRKSKTSTIRLANGLRTGLLVLKLGFRTGRPYTGGVLSSTLHNAACWALDKDDMGYG